MTILKINMATGVTGAKIFCMNTLKINWALALFHVLSYTIGD